jgi:hypothetical protein
MGKGWTAQNTTADRRCASVPPSSLAEKISVPCVMIRSSMYYTFLNKATKSGHVSSSGINVVQKYYSINKLKSIFQGLTVPLFARWEVLYLPPSKWKPVSSPCRCSTSVWRWRKHWCHGNETMLSLCIVDVRVVVNNTESFATDIQQCVLRIVALHTSLLTIWNTLRSACKGTNFFVRF